MSYLREHDEHTRRDGFWSALVVTVESTLGAIQVEACDACGYIASVLCEHQYNTWYDANGIPAPPGSLRGRVLLCNLCGIDGT